MGDFLETFKLLLFTIIYGWCNFDNNNSLSPLLVPPSSIEEDFVTWKENLWSTVCKYFGIDSSQQVAVTREYELVVHSDISCKSEKVFVGEPHRLQSFKNQKL